MKHIKQDFSLKAWVSHTRKKRVKKQFARWYFLYLHFLVSGNLGPSSEVLILDINLSSFVLISFIDGKCFRFYPPETPVNGGSLHWIQLQCADAYDKLPSMVRSQPIICFLILDWNKYSQVGSLLAHSFFGDLKLDENYFFIVKYGWPRSISFLSRILRRLHKFQWVSFLKETRHLAVSWYNYRPNQI